MASSWQEYKKKHGIETEKIEQKQSAQNQEPKQKESAWQRYKRENGTPDSNPYLRVEIQGRNQQRQKLQEQKKYIDNFVGPTMPGQADAMEAAYYREQAALGAKWKSADDYRREQNLYRNALQRATAGYNAELSRREQERQAEEEKLSGLYTALKRDGDLVSNIRYLSMLDRYSKDGAFLQQMGTDAARMGSYGLYDRANKANQGALNSIAGAYSDYRKEADKSFAAKLEHLKTEDPESYLAYTSTAEDVEKKLTELEQQKAEMEGVYRHYYDEWANDSTSKSAEEHETKEKAFLDFEAKLNQVNADIEVYKKAQRYHKNQKGKALYEQYLGGGKVLDPESVKKIDEGKARYEADRQAAIAKGGETLNYGLNIFAKARGVWRGDKDRLDEAGWDPTFDTAANLRSEDENTFYALYADDPKKAMDFITYANNYRNDQYEQWMSEWAHEDGWNATGAFFQALGNRIGSGAVNLVDPHSAAANQLARTGSSLLAGGAQLLNEWSGTIDTDIPILRDLFNGKGLGDFYQLANSVLESGINAYVAGKLGAYIPGGGAEGMAALGTMIMGSSASAADYNECIKRGLTPGEAQKHALAAGINEALFEFVSMDKLIDTEKLMMAGTMKDKIKAIFIQSGVEASEEFCTTVANRLADGAQARRDGYDSQIEHRAKELIAMGRSRDEALEMAEKEWLTELINDAIGGFISGGLHDAGALAITAPMRAVSYVQGERAINRTYGQITSDAQQAAMRAYAADNGIAWNSTENGATVQNTQTETEGADSSPTAQNDNEGQQTQEQPKTRQEKRQERREEKAQAKSEREIGADVRRVQEHIDKQLAGKTVQEQTAIRDKLMQQYGEAFAPAVYSAVRTNAYQQAAQNANPTAIQAAKEAALEGVTDQDMRRAVSSAYDQAAVELAVRTKNTDALGRYYQQIRGTGTGTMTMEAIVKGEDGQETRSAITGMSEDGKTVTLADGSTVAVKELQADADTMDIIHEISALGLGKNTDKVFQAYKKSGKTGLDGYRWIMDYTTAIEQGRNRRISLQEAIKRSSLDAETVMEAYEMGHKETMDETRKAVQKNENRPKRKGVTGRVANIDTSAIQNEPMSKQEREQFDLANQIFELLGVDVKWESSKVKNGKYVGANGSYLNGAVTLDIHAGRNDVIRDINSGILATTGHELTHFLQEFAPEQYQALKEFVLQQIVKNGKYGEATLERMIQDKKRRSKNELSRRRAEDEVVADACQTMLRDSKALREFAEQKPEAAKGIIQWLADWFKKIKAAFSRSAQLSEQARFMEKLEKDVREAFGQFWDDALREAVRVHDEIGNMESPATEGGEQLSEREHPIDPEIQQDISDAVSGALRGSFDVGTITAGENSAINRFDNTKPGYKGKYTGGRHIATADSVKHALEEHGNVIREALRSQLPLTETDIARMMTAIKNGRSRVIAATKTAEGRPSVLQAVEVNGYTLYAEEILRPKKQNGTQDLMNHTTYKAPTMPTAAALPTSDRTLPKRQSNALYELSIAHNGNKSSGSFVADKNGNAAKLYYAVKNGAIVQDQLLGAVALASSDENVIREAMPAGATVKSGYIKMQSPFVITENNRVFSNSNTDVAAEIRRLRQSGVDGFIFDYKTGDNYAVMFFNKGQIVDDLTGWSKVQNSDRDYNKTVILEESTIDKYLRDYASKTSHNYAQAYIVRMSPNDFLNLTTSKTGRDTIWKQTGELDVDKLKKATIDQPFQLNIDTKSGQVEGHEGRHRAMALYNNGVRSIPVLLFDRSNKYDKTALDSLKLKGQDFGNSRSDATVTVQDVQPLSYANRDNVVQKFTTQPTAERMGEKYSGKETIRYSDRDYDNTGRELSEGQQEYFKDSRARDLSGRLLVLYHQTDNDFTIFDPRHEGAGTRDQQTPFGIFLKSSDRDIGVKGKKQMALYANITKPLVALNRENLESKLRDMFPEYAKLSDQHKALDQEYKQKHEQAKQAFTDYLAAWRKQHPNAGRSEIYQDADFDRLWNAEDEIVEEWEQKAREVETETKEVLTNALEAAGYDGIFLGNDTGSWGRSTDAYIALHPEQVKNVDNLNPTENQDIRYSERDYDTTSDLELMEQAAEEWDEGRWNELLKDEAGDVRTRLETAAKSERKLRDLQRKFEKLQADIQEFEGEGASRIAVKDFTRNVLDSFGIPSGQRTEVGQLLQSLTDYLLAGNHVNRADILPIFEGLVQSGKRQLAADDALANIREDLKGRRIYVDKTVREEFGDDYEAFRRRAFGLGITLTGRNTDTGIDTVNAELADTYPGSFDASETDLKAALENIVDTAESGKTSTVSLLEALAEEERTTGTPVREQLQDMLDQFTRQIEIFEDRARLERKARAGDAAEIAKLKSKAHEAANKLSDMRKERDALRRKVKNADNAKQKAVNDALRKLVVHDAKQIAEAVRQKQELSQKLADQIEREKQIVSGALKPPAMQKLLKVVREEAATKAEEHKDEVFKRYKERKEATAIRGRIANLKTELQRRLTNPTDRSYVPAELATSMVDLLDALDTSPREGTQAAAKYQTVSEGLRALAEAYNSLTTDETVGWEYKSEYDEEIRDQIKELAKTMQGRNIRELNLEELQQVYEAVKTIRDSMRQATKLLNTNQFRDIYEAVQSIVDQQKRMTPIADVSWKERNKRRRLLEGLSVMRAVEMMSGWERDAALYSMFQGVEQGQVDADNWIMGYDKAMRPLKTGKNEKAYRDALTKQMDFGATDKESGKTVNMTKLQAIQLYMTWQREQANDKLVHLQKGGATIRDALAIQNGKGSRAASHTVRVTPELISNIENSLTEWDRAYMKEIRGYLDKEAKAVNRVLYALKHRVLATEAAYMPYVVDKGYLETKLEGSDVFNLFVKTPGSTQALQRKAPQPVIIDGLDNMMARHVRDQAQYIGLALPIRDFAKVFNGRLSSDDGDVYTSLKKTIEDNFEAGGTHLLVQALLDIQNSGVGEAWKSQIAEALNRLHSSFVKAALLINPSVTIKQAASYIAAESVLSQVALERGNHPIWTSTDKSKAFMPGGLIAHLFNSPEGRTAQRLYDEIDEHTSMHYIRRQGMSHAELANEAQRDGRIKRAANAVGARMEQNKAGHVARKAGEMLNPLTWIQRMDVATTATLWVACKEQAKLDGMKAGTTEYWNRVTELYERCLRETQPMYDGLHRTAHQKQGGGLMQYLFPFRTVPVQNHGQIVAAYETMKAMKGQSKEKQAAAKKFFAKTVWAQTQSAVVFSLMTFLAAALKRKTKKYRDEDEEFTMESFLEGLGGDTASTLFSVAFPMWGSEAWSAGSRILDKIEGTSGYSYDAFTVGAVDMLNELASSGDKLFADVGKMIRGEDVSGADFWSHTLAMLTKGAKIAGIPADTVKTYYAGIKANVQDAVEGRIPALNDETWERATAVNANRFYKAWSAGDAEKMQTVLNEVEASGKSEDSISSAFNSAAKDAYEAGEISLEEYADYLEKTGMFDDEKISGKIKTILKAEFTAGSRSGDETIDALITYCGMDEDKAWETVQKWEGKAEHPDDEDYSWSKYDDLRAAIDANQDISGIVAELTAHGTKEADIRKEAKEHITKQFVDGKISEDKFKNWLARYCGITNREDAAEIVNDAKCKRDTGYTVEKLGEGYRAGDVGKTDAKTALTKYGGLTGTDADKKIRWWDQQKLHPDLEITEGACNNWYDGSSKTRENGHESAKAAGMSLQAYLAAKKELDKISDANGNSTGEDEYIAALAKMNLTPRQKDALYYEKYKGTTKYSTAKSW